jgi:hypothetical protein
MDYWFNTSAVGSGKPVPPSYPPSSSSKDPAVRSMSMLVSVLGLQPQPHVCHPVQLHRACTRMDEAALIDDQPLTAPARVKRVTLPPSMHTHNNACSSSPACAHCVCALTHVP